MSEPGASGPGASEPDEPRADEHPDGRHWEEALPRFSLTRRVTVLVLMMTAIVVGVVSTIGIPLELIPRGFEPPSLMIEAPWRDAPPKELLDKVILPLEEELSTVGSLEEISAYATVGAGRVFLTFKTGTDMDVAYREVRDGILRARATLPDDVEQIQIHKESESSIPIMVIGVAVDPSVSDPYNLIQQEIVMPLSRIDGVATVRSDGLQEKEVLIELDREATEAAGLNVYQIATELRADNFSLASGNVRDGDKKLLLRSISRYEDLRAIEDQLVSPTVRLGDIAKVGYQVPDQYWRARVNGKPAMAVEVLKEGQANTIEVGTRLNKAFAEIKNSPRLQGTLTGVLFSQRDIILESLDTLLGSGRVGAIFAVIVLLFFLRRFRLTLVITLSIPLSLVVALTAMYFAGETLNILSLLGLIISVGLLVDNSVVVAENIYRLYQSGVPRREACIRGAGEIALAVVLATLTTIIVFLPVSLVEGRAQFFLMRLAAPVGVSLAASLAVALIIVPLLVYLTLDRRGAIPGVVVSPEGDTVIEPERTRAGHKRSRVGAWVQVVHRVMDRILGTAYDATLGRLNAGYTRVLAFFLRHRLDLVLAMIVIFAVTVAVPFQTLDIVDVSREDTKSFRVRVDLPQNYSLDDAGAFFQTVEAALEGVKEELVLDGYLVVHGNVWGRVQGWFPDNDSMSPRYVQERIMEILPKRAGVKYYSGSEDEAKVRQEASEFAVVLSGEDPEELAELARGLEELFQRVDGVLGIKRSRDMAPNELALVVDRDQAQRFGASPRVIAGVIATALRGQPLPRFHRDGREIPVRLRFAEEDRDSLDELANFDVPTLAGGAAQLGQITDVQFRSAQRGIFRRAKRISHRVVVDLAEGKEQQARKQLRAIADRMDLPEGVRLGSADAAAAIDDDKAAMQFAMWISIIFIYFLMGFLFESFVLPASIIFTIPMAGVGVAWIHHIVDRDLDFLGFIGVILLIGVVVNNGIVLVDYIGRLRRAGHARAEAVLLAAQRRFRPIMMTAGTTVSGMVPLAVGEPTSIGLSYKSFGLTLIAGMISATVLTLLVVPVLYTLLDDARTSVLGVIRAAIRGLRRASRR